MNDRTRNQGEGDQKSAKRYNEGVQDFVKSGQVEEAAKKAGEGNPQEMEQAEQAGKERAKEFDPAVRRDYSNPSK